MKELEKDVEFVTLKSSEEVYKERKERRAMRQLRAQKAESSSCSKERDMLSEKAADSANVSVNTEETQCVRSIKRKDRRNEQKKRGWGYELLTTLLYCAVAVALVLLLKQFVVQKTLVEGRSMVETLHNHDQLLVDKISYRFKDPQRFDIIVLKHPTKRDMYYIKRIIGLPGETVQNIGNDIMINGQKIEESYGAEAIQSAGRAAIPIVLGKDEYFVLGDNRNNSSDSRDPNLGNIPRDLIIGRAFIRIWPLDRFGVIE